MKKISFKILVIFHFYLFLSSISAENLYNYVSKNSILHFSCDENEGSSLFDYSFNNNNGIIQTKRQTFSEGFFDLGITTNETLKSILIPNSNSFNLKESFTVMFWVKPISFGDKRKLISQRSSTKLQSFFTVGENMGALYAVVGQGKDFVITDENTKLEINKWQHVAFSLNNLKKEITLYLNGKLISKLECPYTLLNSDASFCIGADLEGTTQYFDGTFDEINIIKASISEKEMEILYNDYLKLTNNEMKKIIFREKNISLYFPFNETKGDKVYNFIPGQAYGNLTNIQFVKGIRNGGINFNGKGNNVEMYNIPNDIFNNNFTVNFWVNSKHNEKKHTILNIHDITNKNLSLKLFIEKNEISLSFQTDGKTDTIISKNDIKQNAWTMLTFTYDADSKTFELYVDDKLIEVKQVKSSINFNQLKIILGDNIKSNQTYLKAKLDEFTIYAKKLSYNEITDIFNTNPLPFFKINKTLPINAEEKKIITYYSFDNCTSKTSLDISPANLHGKIQTKTADSFISEGFIGQALDFYNETILIIPPSHYYENISNFTFACFIYPNSINEKQLLFTQTNKSNKDKRLAIGLNEGKLFCEIGDGLSVYSSSLNEPLMLNEWQHIAVTFDFSSGEISFYINGNFIKKEMSHTPIPGFFDIPTFIGGNETGNYFQGKMDELMFYSTTLSQIEIKDLMTSKEMKKVEQDKEILLKIKEDEKEEKISVKEDNDKITQASLTETKVETKALKAQIENSEKFETLDFSKFYEPKPHSPTKLNIIPFYKKNKLLFHYAFESNNLTEIMDETNAETIFKLVNVNYNAFVSGYTGNAIYLNKEMSAEVSNISLKIPINFSFSFFIFPLLDEENVFKSLVSIQNFKRASIFEVLMKNNRIFIKNPNHENPFSTNVLLMKNAWQNLLFSIDSGKNILSINKNDYKFDSIKLESAMQKDLTLSFGKSANFNSVNCVIDEITAFNSDMSDLTKFPDTPINPAIRIKDGNKIINEKFTLLLFCQNATEYILSYQNDFIDARWKPFTSKVEVPSKQINGNHKIYCKFRNADYIETETISYEYTFGSKEIEFINPVPDSTIPGKRQLKI